MSVPRSVSVLFSVFLRIIIKRFLTVRHTHRTKFSAYENTQTSRYFYESFANHPFFVFGCQFQNFSFVINTQARTILYCSLHTAKFSLIACTLPIAQPSKLWTTHLWPYGFMQVHLNKFKCLHIHACNGHPCYALLWMVYEKEKMEHCCGCMCNCICTCDVADGMQTNKNQDQKPIERQIYIYIYIY